MGIIPVSIVDNFFENPHEIRKFALAQEYFPHPNGVWPGGRTKYLHELCPDLFNGFVKQVLRTFYPKEGANCFCSLMFQKIPKNLGHGWIHADTSTLTAMVYLNEKENLGAGTSIYRPKKNILFPTLIHTERKKSLYQGKESLESVAPYEKMNNDQFEETVKISAVFNRMVAFDSMMWHGAQDLEVGENDERLILIGFFSNLDANGPIRRSRDVD